MVEMTADELKEYVHEHPEVFLRPDKKRKGYVCPLCKSGTGKNGTGITTKDGIHFTCWAGCFRYADILDIIGQVHNVDSYPDKLQATAEEYGVILRKKNSHHRKHI